MHMASYWPGFSFFSSGIPASVLSTPPDLQTADTTVKPSFLKRSATILASFAKPMQKPSPIFLYPIRLQNTMVSFSLGHWQ